MKKKYKKFTNLYMYYLIRHHKSILPTIFGCRKNLSNGSWNRLNRLIKINFIMEKGK